MEPPWWVTVAVTRTSPVSVKADWIVKPNSKGCERRESAAPVRPSRACQASRVRVQSPPL